MGWSLGGVKYRVAYAANNHPKYCRKMSQKENSLKWREHNLFTKKVPRDAEAANIQVRELIQRKKDLVSLVKGCHNGAALSPHGRLHPFEFSGALGRLLRDHETHEVSGLVAGAPWDWSLFAFTRSSPGSSHDRSLLL